MYSDGPREQLRFETNVGYIEFNAMGSMVVLDCPFLNDRDIRDLSKLPRSLRYLTLGNELTGIDFHDLPRGLKELYLGGNRIHEVGEGNGLPLSLEHLDLEDVRLFNLSLAALPRTLRHLIVSDNYIKELDLSALGDALRILKLDRNRLRRIDLTVLRTDQMEGIDLRGNPLDCDFVGEWTYGIGIRHGMTVRIDFRGNQIVFGTDYIGRRLLEFL